MTNENLKAFVKEALRPFFDNLIDTCYNMALSIQSSLPSNMSEKDRDKAVLDVLSSTGSVLISSIKNVVPKDFDKKLKEAWNGK